MQPGMMCFVAVLAVSIAQAGIQPGAVVFEPDAAERSYRARARGYDLLLGAAGAALSLTANDGSRRSVRMRFLAANPAPGFSALDLQESVVNHFRGNDPRRWRAGLPTFGRIRYTDLYPGIDLDYYIRGDAIEYDLVVSPGGAVDSIRMCLEGADAVTLSDDGELTVTVGGAQIVMKRLTVYQNIGGDQVTLAARYRLLGPTEMAFEIEAADASEAIVIDPVIVRYASYLGGSLGDGAFGVAVDGDHNVYVTGLTYSPDLDSSGAFQPSLAGSADIFLTKLSPQGQLIYSTYLGGTSAEVGGPFSGDGWNDVKVDPAGNIYLTGTTRSRDFPITPNAVQPEFGGGPDDVFVAKLSPDGKRLIYSTYLGGSGEDQARAIAMDRGGSAYVTGRTQSPDFPTRNAFQPNYGGAIDAFITKLSADGSELVFSSFLGGGDIEVGRDIAVDGAGSAYLAGRTVSRDFPASPQAFQTVYGGTGAFGQGDGFAAKVSSEGLLFYATFLGGTGGEIASGIAVDRTGHAYISGITESADFPTTAESVQPRFAGGGSDGFLIKLDPGGGRAIYSTFLGGPGGDDQCFSVAVDARGEAYCAGVTFSTAFPTVDAFQTSLRGETDAFVLKLDSAGSRLFYSSYLGGSGRENGFRIAIDNAGNAYAVGGTRSADFPVTSSAIKTSRGGDGDAFLAIITHVEDAVGERQVRVIPVAGSTSGIPGPLLRTSFQLHNPTDHVISGSVVFRRAGSSDPTSTPLSYLLGARQTLAYTDLLAVMGESGIGSVDLLFPHHEEPVVVAWVFQDEGEAGTTGMSQTAVSTEAALAAGESGVLIAPLDPATMRLEIGMRALEGGGTIRLVRRNSSGTIASSAERNLEPNVFIQVSASELFGAAWTASDSITVQIEQGSAILYGMSSDNRTKDPSVQLAKIAPSVQGEKTIVPVVGSLRGAFGSNFRTAVQLHNPTDGELRGHVVFHPAGRSDAAGDVSFDYVLAPRQTMGWEDLPAFLSTEGLGSLEIQSTRGVSPVSLSHIYNDSGEQGTNGMTAEALRLSESISAGAAGILIAPPDPLRTRFNLGFRTLESAVEMTATVRDRSGNVVARRSLSLPPHLLIQRNAGVVLGVAISGSDTICMEVSSGSVVLYGTATDNTTNDPSMQLATPVSVRCQSP